MVDNNTAQNMILVNIGACGHITYEDVASKRELIASADWLLVQLEINVDALEHIVDIASKKRHERWFEPGPSTDLV